MVSCGSVHWMTAHRSFTRPLVFTTANIRITTAFRFVHYFTNIADYIVVIVIIIIIIMTENMREMQPYKKCNTR